MEQNLPKVHMIITGGTIDSFYDIRQDTVVPNTESVIPTFLAGLHLYQKITYTTVCMKDSRNITPSDLQSIKKIIEEDQEHQKFIITHGTYTMPDSARFLKANLNIGDKTIIFTASMIPIVGFSPSDGPFNLGYTIAAIHSAGPGVYVAVNGRLFAPEEIVKLIPEGRFTSIFDENQD